MQRFFIVSLSTWAIFSVFSCAGGSKTNNNINNTNNTSDNCLPGETQCSNSGYIVQGCGLVDGFYDWMNVTNCADDAKVCKFDEGTSTAKCGEICEDPCSEDGATQCSGNWIQTCVKQSSGCYILDYTIDCAEQSKACTMETGSAACHDAELNIYFSEYIEGSQSNRALELFLATSPGNLELSNCHINIYSNGSTSSFSVSLPQTTFIPGNVFVLCNSGFSSPEKCDKLDAALIYHGNDAIELECNGSTYDIIGQIGYDPGEEWISGGVSTKDQTLRRKPTVMLGDRNGNDTFYPDSEWDSFPIDSFDNLGVYP